MEFLVTIEVKVEVTLNARDEDGAWVKAEEKTLPAIEEAIRENLPDGASVYGATVSEVEEG